MFDKSPAAALDYHRSMLADGERTGVLRRAISATVKPGDKVLDLGCGTGILACFACLAGAKRVYAIESEPIIELAKSVCTVNGFAERIVFINAPSTRVQLPEHVDVVVTETIGNMALEEGILGWTLDARRRFLRPGGILIPRALTLFACPVELPRAYASVSDWDDIYDGLDFTSARRLAAHNPAWLEIPTDACLAEPPALGRIDLMTHEGESFSARTCVTATRSGVCHGLGVWFHTELTATESVTNAPPRSCPSWQNGFLPLELPLRVHAGDELALELDAEVNGSLWHWRLTPHAAPVIADRPRVATPLQSTLAGRFLSMQHLRKGAGGYVPRLRADGEAAAFILARMTGTSTISAIADVAFQRFPELFKTSDDALALVRKLSRHYT